MANSIVRLLSATNARLNLSLKSRYLAGHISYRYIQEFPQTKFDNTSPRDYLLVLPEKLNEVDNETLRLPQIGEPEIDFSKINTEVCFKGLSQALCTFENFVTDVNNQVSPPYNNAGELFKDVEKHLVPLDSAYNILMVMRTINNQDYAHKEIHDLIKRYYDVRGKRFLGSFRDSLRSFSLAKNLTQSDRKMFKLYQVNPRQQSSLRPFDDSSIFHFQKNLQDDFELFNRNLHAANQMFTHTIDDPDILAAVSSDFDDCQELHHRERTPLQITTGTYHKFMQVCPDRFVRQRMWQTFNRRCSPKGPPRYNNEPVIKSIRIWKRKLADLLGHRSHLEYRLEDTMASSRKRVMDCLETINKENSPRLQERLQELTEFALDNKLEDPTNVGLQEYDIDYWSHRYVHDILIGVSETDLKGYFPFTTVMNGIQDYFNKFLSINMKLTKSDKFWSEHVQLIELTRKGQPLGTIIYDPFYRSPTNPYDSIQARIRSRVQGSNHLPARVLSTPFKLDQSSKTAHLAVTDVLGLFWAFSSVIQELLYNYEYYELNTYGALEPDVEDLLPSLCLAHIQSDHRILQSCSSRSGGKPIDSELTNRILKAITFFSPFNTKNELYKAHLDQEIHALLTETKTLAEEIHLKYSPFDYCYDYCTMGEIFIGPRDGVQYSNLWARQLANFCLSHNISPDGRVDEAKMKQFYNSLVDSLYYSSNLNSDDKLTALIGKRFEPSEPIPGVLQSTVGHF
uniref:Oligopeptidase A n=1 Tax=Aceria tosichella TaxID=561515 RepID=A0A6G1SNW5_9ACAR